MSGIEEQARAGRFRRMAESERYPSWCIQHRRQVKWIPAPGWWIHADWPLHRLDGAHTCVAMWDARAPEGKEGG